MSLTVPTGLQSHLDQSSNTTCLLLKITTTLNVVFGITSLDRDVPYDDGTTFDSNGDPITVNYVASNGFDPSAMVADLGLSVGNAEGYALLSDSIPGVTQEMLMAGDFDDAQWICYMVDFENLSNGHAVRGAGDVGAVRARYGRLWIPELLDYIIRLKQPIGSVWSRRCRAIFGTPAESQSGCGVDLGPLWVTGTVTSVGAEADLEFDGSASTATIEGTAAMAQFLTGANAGREYAIEYVDSGGNIHLIETANYPIEVGDTYRIRPDCLKRYEEDCIAQWANGPNFKGEPLIPVGDGQQGQTPGAQLPGGGGSKFTS